MGISTSRALNTSETEAIEQLQAQQQCQWDEERHLPLLMRLWAGLHPEGEPFERESWRWRKVIFSYYNFKDAFIRYCFNYALSL